MGNGLNKDSSECKLVVCGMDGSGKSAFIMRFVCNKFVPDHDVRSEESYRKVVTIRGRPCVVTILDTAQCEADMHDTWYRCAEGFVFLYDITNRKSLEALYGVYVNLLSARGCMRPPCVVVGNKLDLAKQLTDARLAEFLALHKAGFTSAASLSSYYSEVCNAIFPIELADIITTYLNINASLRQVAHAEGASFAKSVDGKFFEISAKTNEGVGEAFSALIFEARVRAS